MAASKNMVTNLKPNMGDGIDRLNYVYTCSMLAILIVFVGSHYYFIRDPIQCWMPDQLQKESWEKYVKDYCYVQNTYFARFENDTFPSEWDKYEQEYYHWVPLILVVQYLLFLLPNVFWTLISRNTGLNTTTILSHVNDSEPSPSECIDSEAWAVAKYIHEIIRFNSRRKIRLFGLFSSESYNKYFTATYLHYKFLNFLNAYTQLLMMTCYLPYTFGGIGLLRDLMIGKDWKFTGHFPRVTFCDVSILNDSSNLSMNFTVQCVLPNNMLNEKNYMFLWFWFAVLTLLNFVDLFYWIFTSFNHAWKIKFIKAQLELNRVNYDSCEIYQFYQKWIKMDGLTAIRLISANFGDLVSSEIIGAMFLDFNIEELNKAKSLHKRIYC